jgi:hypothetical protein
VRSGGAKEDDMRHKWFIERSTHEVCTRCGLVKNRRRHGNFHWTEYKATDGKWFTSDKTPLCEQPQAQQVAEKAHNLTRGLVRQDQQSMTARVLLDCKRPPKRSSLELLLMSKKFSAVHPGEVLREEFLVPMKFSPYAVARMVSRSRLRNGRPIGSRNRRTDNIFVRLENRGDTDCWTRGSGFNCNSALG